jgi:uridine phosphorylase
MEQDSLDQPIFTAADLLAYRKAQGTISNVTPPEAAVLCFHSGALRRAVRKRRVKKLSGFFGETYLVREAAGKVALVGNFGIGAPSAVVALEDLAAFGVKRFLATGIAGGLQNSLRCGDIVVCTQAIRDEGTSRHYLEPSKMVDASPDLSQLIQDALTSKGDPPQIGTTWTTDAPYRELRRDVLRYQKEGVKTVEMEAAALFAAGKSLGVHVGAAFVIGDTLFDLKWQMSGDEKKVLQGFAMLIDAAIWVLKEDPALNL